MHKINWLPINNTSFLTLTLVLACLIAGCNSAFPLSESADTPLKSRASQVIYNGLNDAEPIIRSNAVEVVGSTRLMPLMPRVVQLFRDPVVPVRFQALIAAGDMRYTMAMQDVQQIYMEPQEDINVRMAAAYALVQMGSRQQADFYMQQIKNPDPTIRANAALLIGKGGQRSGLPLLEWAINDPQSDERVRLQALESLAMLQSPSAYEKIWTRLISAFADDRITGIRAMAYLGNNQAISAIATMLDDEVPEVRLAAAEQLGKLNVAAGEKEVMDVLEKPVSGDMATQMRLKIMSAMAIGEIDSEPLAKHLPRLLKDPSTIVQLAAAKAIFRRGMP
ncbi:MAG: HEAT repeat domain-containing protein [Phycisphaerae bacterium]|nr:HEAT repeat domain-containing protein [Phycisphaerae bacterium]